jgi:hypothetical protein
MVISMVSAEQQQVLNFLRTSPDCYFSAMEISRKAGNRKQYEEEPRWAINCLRYLLDMKLVIRDGRGHYKFATDDDKRNEKAAPQPGH